MPSFLIDLTDPRFFTPENADVLAFIRRVNPFAHSDLGTIVFECARRIDSAQAYRIFTFRLRGAAFAARG